MEKYPDSGDLEIEMRKHLWLSHSIIPTHHKVSPISRENHEGEIITHFLYLSPVTINAYYESSAGQEYRVPSKYNDVNKLKFFYKMHKSFRKTIFLFSRANEINPNLIKVSLCKY